MQKGKEKQSICFTASCVNSTHTEYSKSVTGALTDTFSSNYARSGCTNLVPSCNMLQMVNGTNVMVQAKRTSFLAPLTPFWKG